MQTFKYANVQMYKCANMQMYKYANVQIYKCGNVQMCKCAIMQMFKCTNVLKYTKCANVQMFRQQELQQETGQHTLRGARWETLLQGWNKIKVFEKSRIRKKTIVWCCKKYKVGMRKRFSKESGRRKKQLFGAVKK